VRFRLTPRDLSYWSSRARGWVLEAGEFDVAVGASSRDLRLGTCIELDAPPIRPPLDGMATLQEWLADPDGAAALHAAVGTDAQGRPHGILGDEGLQRLIGNFPISSLATFPGMGITHEAVRRLTAG
jgi:beta-glucosidase